MYMSEFVTELACKFNISDSIFVVQYFFRDIWCWLVYITSIKRCENHKRTSKEGRQECDPVSYARA